MENTQRIVWVDWMRVIACFMVMVVHSTEPFYLGGDGSLIASEADMWWSAIFDSMVRCCVPLFVVASSFLQFPLHYDAVTFARKRAVRILVPFVFWSVFYALYWGEPVQNLKDLALNFNYAAGHLWFVYMLLGLYIIMPLLSPWAEKVSRKELSIYIGIWLFTTIIPLIRAWAGGAPSAVVYGPSGLPRTAIYPLWGETSWNSYGTFYYMSGLVGYMLLGLWFRRYGCEIPRARALRLGVLGYLIGVAIVMGGFVMRVMETSGGVFPTGGTVLEATWWETTWCFDTLGVAVMTIGMILLFQNIGAGAGGDVCAGGGNGVGGNAGACGYVCVGGDAGAGGGAGRFYQRVILPVSKASYGMYLGHMVALSFYAGFFRSLVPEGSFMCCGVALPSTPLIIVATAVCSFITVALAALALQRIPKVGKYIIG